MSGTKHESKLLDAIAKQNALLTAVRDKKHPDFAFLWTRAVLLQQAQCWLSLARLRRLSAARSFVASSGGRNIGGNPAPFQLQPTPLGNSLIDSVNECLAHARRIYFDGDVSAGESVTRGRVLLLVEEAEVLVLQGRHNDALARFDEAVQMCHAHSDHATESIVLQKVEALRLELATWAKLDQLVHNPEENAAEREILSKCFAQLTLENGTSRLRKDQLVSFARDLGTHTALQADEVDDIWSQIAAHDTTRAIAVDLDSVDFDALWRWWMTEEMYSFRSQLVRRQ